MPKLKENTIMPTDDENRQINAGISADPDTYEASDADFNRMCSVATMHPDIPARVRGPQIKPTKQSTTIRLNTEILTFFKNHGRGWQTEVNDILQTYVDQHHLIDTEQETRK